MSLPIVAVVGRPNVGKSTFVNRIAQSDSAIVHEMSGVTRDRSFHTADWNGVEFSLVDTGGMEIGSDDKFQDSITNQAIFATEEADVVLFLVDGKADVTADDQEIAQLLKRAKKPVYLLVNKMDNPAKTDQIWEFYQLGLGEPWPISAAHGNGTGDMLDALVEDLRKIEKPADEEDLRKINVAIIGRPNAGKSSLSNRLTNTERSIVYDEAGTTRDSIDVSVVRGDTEYTFVDTAGLRKKSAVSEDVEYYSFVRAVKAIDRCEVAILVIDASIGLTDQDQRVAGMAHERGCALIICLNKWDLVKSEEAKKELRTRLEDRMMFVSYAPVLAISALHGTKVTNIFGFIDKAYESFNAQIPTSKLNLWLAEVKEAGHTVTKGKAILRLSYVTQTGSCPPVFTLFVNRPDIATSNYMRFLENSFRKKFPLQGTPIKCKLKKK